ncbi:MAG: type I glyceraldehyde-3-phosphate dehydrogenase, partial [Phototrophicales bacterium]
FGRIGRLAFKVMLERQNIEVVAINDLTDPKTLGHLLKYDSVHGKFPGTIKVEDGKINVNGQTIQIFAERNPADLPWAAHSIDVVLECTGIFRDADGAGKHL